MSEDTFEDLDAPPRIPSDEEIQAELHKIALGIVLRNRFTSGLTSDIFVNGGDFAPGRQRWVQVSAFASAAEQARMCAEALS